MKEKFSMRLITQLITQPLNVLSSYFVALFFEVELLGMLAFSKSVIGLFSVLIPLAFASIYYQHNEDKDFEDFFTIFFVYKSILISANYGPLFFMVFFLDPEIQIIFIILLTSNVVAQFSEIFFTHLISKMKVFKTFLPSFILNVIHSILRIVLAFNISIIPNPIVLLTILALIFTSLRFITGIMVSKGEFRFLKFKRNLMVQYLRDSKPLIFSSIFSGIVINLGKLLLNFSYGYETLAYYTLIEMNIIHFLLSFSASIKTLFLSVYSSLFANDKNKQIENMANRVEKYYSIIYLFITITTLLNAELILGIFLPKYLPSINYLYIMIFIPFLAAINRPYSTLLIPGKKQAISAIYASVKIVVKILLTIVIVPLSLFSIQLLGLGALGLSIVELVFWVVDFFFYRYFSKNYFNISSYKRIYVQVLIALDSFIIAFMIKNLILMHFLENEFILLIVSTGVLFLLYFIQLLIFKEFGRKDTKFLLSLVNIKSFKKSLLDELKD